ncbi:MAG: YraN family protein [Gammaproteobacteria bacterium]
MWPKVLLGSRSGSQRRGAQAEKVARQLLEAAGLHYLAANFFCRQGELDLVMSDANVLIFVEVRHRSSSQWGNALQSISRSKQKKLLAAAQFFLLEHPVWRHAACRFDAVTFDGAIKLDNACWHQNILSCDML